MPPSCKITIGIPTFSRSGALVRLVEECNSPILAGVTQVLIGDDASHDDTPDRLSELSRRGICFDYYRNSSNLGYARNFLKIFDVCKTEYLLVMADDDQIIESGLILLLGFIEKQPEYKFISPQWLQNGRIYRGGPVLRNLGPSDFLIARHAPGMLYHVDDTREARDYVKSRIDKGCVYTSMYPQVVLLIYLLLQEKPCCSVPIPVAQEGEAMPSGINDHAGDPYYSLKSRLRQAASFEDITEELLHFDGISEVIIASGVDHLRLFYNLSPPAVRDKFFKKVLGREIEGVLLTPLKVKLRKFFDKIRS